MRFAITKHVKRGVLVAAAASLLALGLWRVAPLRAQAAGPGATFSTPVLLDPNEQFLYAVNPDNDTVSSISLSAASGTKAQETTVGREPQSLAMTNDGAKLYVANARDGTVSVLAVGSGGNLTRVREIAVGVEPWSLVLTPNGRKLYVANSSSGSVSVVDTSSDQVVKTIFRVAQLPRGLAVTSDGDADDNDEKLYVTSFLAQYKPGQVKPGDDKGKVGIVAVVSTATDEVTKSVTLNPINDTGFKSDGDALAKVAPTGTATVVTAAFPNILASAAIKGSRVYVPATGSSPNGPVRFNVILQSLVCAIDTATDTDAGKTVNLNNGVQFEADSNDAAGNPLKRFLTNPYFIAFRHLTNSGYLVSAASNMVVKMDLGADGTPTINPPPAAMMAGNVKRILTGSNPRAMVINRSDTKGYVWNYVSRDVTIVDLATDTAAGRFVLANQPTDSQAVKVQRGKELFNTSIGPLFPVSGVTEGAMADRGWCACSSCHPNGLTDGVVWMFPSGPRLSTPLNSTYAKGGTGQRALNWSAIFDEVADFELNTRGVAGGSGLIKNADGTQDTNVNAFTVPSSGRNADRDSITEYVRLGIRSPISPIPANDVRALEGRKIFAQAGCTKCHGGANWTSSRVEFTPPPPATALTAEQGTSQLTGQLKLVGTFDAAASFELIGTGANISKQALGQLGYNPPSLRGVFAFGPYLHNGSAVTLEELLDNKTHMGTSALLASPAKRKQLVRFLQSIDDSTPTFP
ncbi:MAG TPA: YncE family protein [Thermoanaerobaculia bacterium]|nr:YncE family protein [Thermoanaerobaculia bacterium]